MVEILWYVFGYCYFLGVVLGIMLVMNLGIGKLIVWFFIYGWGVYFKFGLLGYLDWIDRNMC